MTETAEDFIARKSAEWERDRARGKLIRMKDVNREAMHVYRRVAWTFLVQDTYAEAVNVLERLTHLETIGIPAVPMKLPQPSTGSATSSLAVSAGHPASGHGVSSVRSCQEGTWSASWRGLAEGTLLDHTHYVDGVQR